MLKRGRGVSPSFRIQALRKEFDGRTQAVRGSLIADLEELQKWAVERMKKVRSEKMKIKWARIAAYIAQTITYISGEFDSGKIMGRLETLEAKVGALRKKDKEIGKKRRRVKKRH